MDIVIMHLILSPLSIRILTTVLLKAVVVYLTKSGWNCQLNIDITLHFMVDKFAEIHKISEFDFKDMIKTCWPLGTDLVTSSTQQMAKWGTGKVKEENY